MLNKRFTSLIVVLLTAWPCRAQSPAHLTTAEAIATQILPADNEYAHKECFIKWKGAPGVDNYANRTDCSDFFDLLIEHVYGFTRAQLKQWTGHERPTAAVWYDAVDSTPAKPLLQPIVKLESTLPGDMIFIKYAPGGGDTGHVMMIAAAPQKRDPTKPIIEKTQQWAVTVIDSSKSGHGPTDTRHNNDGSFGQGVGKGTLRLYTLHDGSLAGYSWSTVGASKFISVDEHPIALARLSIPKEK